MYLYYDSNGVLQEQINDSAIVQGETCNIIYCYFAGLDLTSKSFQLTLTRVSSGTSTRTIDGVVTPNVTIPYNAQRDLRYFQYYYPNGTNTGYTMVAFALNSETDLTTSDTYAGNPLIVGGTSDFYEPITFNVESNHITANEAITSSQYTYLLALAKGTIYANGISLSLANSVLTASIDDGKGGSSSSDVTLPYLPIEGGSIFGNVTFGGIDGTTRKYPALLFQDSMGNDSLSLLYGGLTAKTYSSLGVESKYASYLSDSVSVRSGGSGSYYRIYFPYSDGTFATQEWVNNALLGYYTTTETDTEISNALSDYSTTAQMATAITAGVNALLSSSNSWSGTNSFTVDPTFNGSPFVTESTYESVFNSTIITASDIVNKLGTTPVNEATHAKTADSTSTAGQPISLLLTYVDSETKTVSVPFVAKSSYYGIFHFDQITVVETGEIRTSLTVAGVESSTAFTSSTDGIYFRVEVSYLGDTGDYAGKYAVVLTNLNLSVDKRAIVSLPTYLIAIANNDSQFTAQGVPTASAYGTLQIVS